MNASQSSLCTRLFPFIPKCMSVKHATFLKNICYHFFLTTAVGGTVNTTFGLPGSGVSNFFGALELMGGSAANPASDVAGDTLTWVNSTEVNARASLTCMTDDGTNSTWKAESLSTPIATIA